MDGDFARILGGEPAAGTISGDKPEDVAGGFNPQPNPPPGIQATSANESAESA